MKKIVKILNRIEKNLNQNKEHKTDNEEGENSFPDLNEYRTRKEAIFDLGISGSTYTRWKEKGIIKVKEVGNKDYISPKNMKRALKESNRTGKR